MYIYVHVSKSTNPEGLSLKTKTKLKFYKLKILFSWGNWLSTSNGELFKAFHSFHCLVALSMADTNNINL